jgi:hypothetical protein
MKCYLLFEVRLETAIAWKQNARNINGIKEDKVSDLG